MRASHILLLIVAIKAVKFLDEPAVLLEDDEKPYMQFTVFAQQSSLFTDEELARNSEPAKQYESGFNFEDENQSALNSADQSQVLLAAQYENDLPATGDCVVLYSACDFKGTSGKVCKAEDAMNFQIPIFSIYVPIGQQFTTLDSTKNEQVAFLTSEKCLNDPLVMADTQKDVFIAKPSLSLAGSDIASSDDVTGPQPQLIQETQDQFDAPQIEEDQQVNVEQVQEQVQQTEQVQEQVQQTEQVQEQVQQTEQVQEQVQQTEQVQEQVQQTEQVQEQQVQEQQQQVEVDAQQQEQSQQQDQQQSETPEIQQNETSSQEQQASVDDVPQAAEVLVGQTQ
ncbi:unnamed protein product (macronuclear) [Paramecium tetraurelia]|uniref:Uncharacterized protein n=1 Tax=Paramecium tetraurelia TaxID=5888 RepID=A0BYZ2_PARTE|nr:uncharacterized protein GSPATT00033612001 [Paramecium tetraurelia]CAK63759.1 unnamed protein product [Paramecium tetraurelia]|eukprot:XP_001431157.1 hypothetical protein (macronuclear) [Paramecium tetraurelia strain d4-2]